MKQIFKMKLLKRFASASVAAAYALTSGLCYAQQATPAPSPAVVKASDGKGTEEAKKVVEQPKPPEPRFKLYGWVEAGITGNPDAPIDNHNFGHLYTDRSNEPLLNQLSVVGERALDPNATGFDWGFKAWFMYGSDARYTKSVGFMDLVTDQRVQPDFPELYASVHIPIPGTNGLDIKAGKYQDPMSGETLDPRNNIFYSHSYIFNFGIPENDTGALATLHVNKYLDLYAGVNRGINMTFSDNNSSLAIEYGLGLNLLDGNLTVLALSDAGPENTLNNHDWRFVNDITTTWKITKSFTSITDLNLVVDSLDGGKWAGGVAQYFSYSVNDWLSLGLRGEIYRDSQGFYVAQFRANNDFVHFERGDNVFNPNFPFDPSNLGGGNTTYLEVTGGVTVKPPLPKPIAGLLIRPEVRYDRSINDTLPFSQNTKQDQWTFGVDLVLEF
jgi:hypothetical protein